MKARTILFSAAIAAMAITSSCTCKARTSWEQWGTTAINYKSGADYRDAAKQSRATQPFSSISNDTFIDVIYTQSDRYEITIEGDSRYFDMCHTFTEGDKLIIKMEKGKYVNLKLRVCVSAPAVNGLYVAGSGSIICATPISAEGEIALRVTGSGEINTLLVDYDEINAAVTGSGDLEIEDAATEKAYFKVTGSGDIDVKNIISDEINAEVTGSGDIDINGKANFANAKVTGSGDITGQLMCGKISTRVTGSGDIRLK